jgi:hypothetical protein
MNRADDVATFDPEKAGLGVKADVEATNKRERAPVNFIVSKVY